MKKHGMFRTKITGGNRLEGTSKVLRAWRLSGYFLLPVLLAVSCANTVAQSNPITAPAPVPVPAAVELILKQTPPSVGSFTTVYWSQDERFAAFESDRFKPAPLGQVGATVGVDGVDIVVYDLDSGLEARRLYIPTAAKSISSYQFSPDSNFFFLASGSQVQRCSLATGTPCDTIDLPASQNSFFLTAGGDLVYADSSSSYLITGIGGGSLQQRKLSDAEVKQQMLGFALFGNLPDNKFSLTLPPAGKPVDTWSSPNRRAQVFTEYDASRHLLLYEKTKGEKGQPPSTSLLAAEPDVVRRLEFSRADAALITASSAVNRWKLVQGGVDPLGNLCTSSASTA